MHTFITSFKRELRRIFREGHERYLVITILGLVFCYVFFLTLMHEGQPERLPIAIVDHDGSYLSRRLCHEVNAMQGVRVVAVYSSHAEAREAMQRQEIYAFLEIPEGTYNELLAFARPHIALYSNNAYLLSGALSYKSLATISKLASGAVQREVLRKKGMTDSQAMGLVQPVELDTHLISNPTANYQPYVLTTMLPGMLGLMVLLLMAYALGVERKERQPGARADRRTAGGNISSETIPWWLGKMAPYTIIYTTLGVLGNIVLFGFCGFEQHGSFLYIALGTLLLVVAMQSMALFLAAIIPEAHMSTTVCALYGTLAFTMAGFSYPVDNMPTFLQGVSQLFPLRHYYLLTSKVSLFGCGIHDIWPHICALFLFQIPGLIGAYKLRTKK